MDFVEQVQDIKLEKGECNTCYDVTTLFASLPVNPSIRIKNNLEQDGELYHRTSMTVGHNITLLEFCLKNTYFLFQGRFFEQIEGVVMDSPISSIVANLYVKYFEIRSINASKNYPRMW